MLQEIFENSPQGKLLHFYDNPHNDLQCGITISHLHKRLCITFAA